MGCCPTPISPRACQPPPRARRMQLANRPPLKYFSSLERLRFAQQCSAVSKQTSAHQRSTSAGSGRLLRPLTRARRSNDSAGGHRPSSKRSKLGRPATASQADAEWFLGLPETIRRKHFSPEERIALVGRFENIIVDAADETLYRLGRQTNRSLDTLDSCSSSTLSEMELGPPAIRIQRRKSLDRDVQSAADEFRKSFRWLDEDGKIDLRLNEFCTTEIPPPSSPKSQKSRRTFSISSTTRTGSSSSNASYTRRPSITSRRTTSCIPVTVTRAPSINRRSYSAHSNNAEMKEAAYYQDPEARLKLRVYLASPQKFDEAIEFGFPSTQDATEFFRPRSPVRQPDAFPTCGEDDGLSMTDITMLSQDKEDEEEDEARPLHSSGSRHGPRFLKDHYQHSSACSREMTLKMTLTRKDLRADDEKLYCLPSERPLATEEIAPAIQADDTTAGFWDTTDKESESGLKKIWRKMTGR